jgi:hypothetical protein
MLASKRVMFYFCSLRTATASAFIVRCDLTAMNQQNARHRRDVCDGKRDVYVTAETAEIGRCDGVTDRIARVLRGAAKRRILALPIGQVGLA